VGFMLFARTKPKINQLHLDLSLPSNIMAEPQNLRTLFASAEAQRKQLESAIETSSSAYQKSLGVVIATYDECRRFADDVSLFSPNETIDDVPSGDLQYGSHLSGSCKALLLTSGKRYMVTNYYLAELITRDNTSDRMSVLRQAREAYEKYLHLLESYDILSNSDIKLFERYRDDRDSFSTASTTDAAARRETKIARFKEEKEMKQKLEVHRKSSRGQFRELIPAQAFGTESGCLPKR
jgi:immunoglobulin-binding protein 1